MHLGFSPVPTVEKLVISHSPKFLHGFSFVFAADFHIRNNSTDAYISSIIDLIKNQDADLLLLGGDYGEDVESTKRLFGFIAPLSFPYGKFACIGNNDKEAFGFNIQSFRNTIGLPLLLNEYVMIPVNKGVLTLIGTDENKYPLALPNRIPPTVHRKPSYSILLSHYPRIPKTGIGSKADLIVSGHTHGGQINLFGFTRYSFTPLRDVNGIRTIKGKRIITCPGIGVSKLPIRFGVRPKIYVISFD